MEELDPEVLEFFKEEAEETFMCLENLLIKGEKHGLIPAELSEVKRILHNLKGTSYSLELTNFGDCIHIMEEYLESNEEDIEILATTFLFFIPTLKAYLEDPTVNLTMLDGFTDKLKERFLSYKRDNQEEEKSGELNFNNIEQPACSKPDEETKTEIQSEKEREQEKKCLTNEVNQVVKDVKKEEKENDIIENDSLPEEDQVAPSTPQVTANTGSEFLKCKVKKVDDLINLFSEQVTLQSSLAFLKKNFKENENKICSTISQLEKVTFDLQKAVFALRMVDLNRVFSVLQRTIRNTEKALNLDVDLTIEGAENELDKSIVDSLIDPLNHLVKNCLDHGLASVTDGRPLKLSIRAFQRSGYFNLEIKDNGMGINKKTVLDKAIECGIAKADVNYSESEIFGFIFKNGFSTKEEACEISGRGVGMNVVAEVIKSFKGVIEVDSTYGEGSTFNIKIPLSLAMFNGLVFDVDGKNYVVANSDIREIIDLKKVNSLDINERDKMVKIRDEVIPIVDAQRIFGGTKVDGGALLVIDLEDQRFAIKVDRVSNQQRVVSRELGEDLSNLNSVSGATILSDGTLAPIVNVTEFLNLAKAS